MKKFSLPSQSPEESVLGNSSENIEVRVFHQNYPQPEIVLLVSITSKDGSMFALIAITDNTISKNNLK